MEIQKQINWLGPLDENLRDDGFALPAEQIIEFASTLTWGMEGVEKLSVTTRELIELSAKLSNTDNSTMELSHLGGLFGNPDEIFGSGEEFLELVSNRDLREARLHFNQLKILFNFMDRQFSKLRKNMLIVDDNRLGRHLLGHVRSADISAKQ